MYRKAAVLGVSSLAVVAVGTAVAVAATDSGSTTGSASGLAAAAAPSASTASGSATPAKTKNGKHDKHGKHGKRGGDRGLFRRLDHGQLTVTGKDGKTQTLTVVQGTVTAVSASSISVQSADKTSQTYAVGSGTVVRDRGTRGKTTISKVAKGDHVFVVGTGSPLTATRVLDTGTK